MTTAARATAIRAKDLVSLTDLSIDEVELVLDTAAAMKVDPAAFAEALRGASVILLFEKPSLRTRISFEVGVYRLGGQAIYMDHAAQRLGVRESVADYGHNLERWVHAIVPRTFETATVRGLADSAAVPVINGLCNMHHPCQALADMLTLREHLGALPGRRLAYIGDGNNVCHSLLHAAAMCGMSMTAIVPEGCEPDVTIVEEARAIATTRGGTIAVSHDPAAVAGHDAVYTDVWISMGDDPASEADRAARLRRFMPYQVNAALMRQAAPGALFMHCLPAKRGLEVTDEVMDGATSVVFDQAENRIHAQNALLALMVGPRLASSSRGGHP